MNDPYSILGVSRNDSNEQIKKAYRELARKYHPDNYVNNPLADLAQEKMKQINEAYDQITRERSGGGSYSSSSASYSQARPQQGYSQGGVRGDYTAVRNAITQGNLDRAEMLLGSIRSHDAEWHFLMGSVTYRRGFYDEAERYFATAVSMAPGNVEYRQAYSYMVQSSRQGRSPMRRGVDEDELCNLCGRLWMMDCCCEMMGGDCIRCI